MSGPSLCADIYLTCHVIAGHAKQPGHPAADSGAMFELHAIATLLLFICAIAALRPFSVFLTEDQNLGSKPGRFQVLIKSSITALSLYHTSYLS